MGKRLEFGASVAGGIPAIIGIQEGLAGDRLYKIAGCAERHLQLYFDQNGGDGREL